MSSQLSKPAARAMHKGHGKSGQPHGRSAPSSDIPDKLYFRIGEVAALCGVETYVLRFWESEFPQLRPTKSGTGQRLYRKRDVEMALKIRQLLYKEGFTIPGARQTLQQESRSGPAKWPVGRGKQTELPLGAGVRPSPLKVQKLKMELRAILGILSTPAGKPRLVGVEKPQEPAPQLFAD